MGRKVDLEDVTRTLLDGVRAIDGDAQLSRGDKTKRLARLADRIKNGLYEDRRRKDEDKLAPASYRRYLTIIRNAVTEQNWRHHSLEESVERIARKHPKWADALQSMLDHADIKDLRFAHRDLLAEVRRARDDDAYEAIRTLKLDHEIMRHLTLPAATKAELAAEAVERLEVQATNSVEINFHWLMATINDLLSAQQLRGDGTVAPYFSHLTLGIALATGRREIEVLKLGRFKKAGEFELEFSGQAKRREGVDYSDSYRIYTLVSADLVLASIKALRDLPEVQELQGLDNVAVNNRVHSNLNQLTKRVFNDPRRVFKDSRKIWARAVFELHYARDAKWKKVNETVFWQAMLGHEDMSTQESYKAFKLDYTKPAEPVAEVSGKWANRLEALASLDGHERIKASSSLHKIHQWVKATVKAAPEARISQKAIQTNVGSYRPNIKEYLEIAAEALATPNRGLAEVAAPVPKEVVKAKPHLTVHQLEDGQWQAVARVNGVDVATVVDGDRMTAMRKAYEGAIGAAS
ncbi:TPA: protelomerase family protein [Pseudomonas aeruginosa]